jgi:hypothetical protein
MTVAESWGGEQIVDVRCVKCGAVIAWVPGLPSDISEELMADIQRGAQWHREVCPRVGGPQGDEPR